MSKRHPHTEQEPLDERPRWMLRIVRVLRTLLGIVTAAVLFLSLVTYWAAQHDYQRQVAQQWEYRCGFLYGQALFLFVLAALGAVITVAIHRGLRSRSQSV